MAPKPLQIVLTATQIELAHQEGQQRYEAIHARNAKPHNQVIAPPANYVLGTMGEIAFAEWSGLEWTASKGADYRPGEPDVGNCEVKTRSHNSDRMIFARLSEYNYYKPTRLYVLAWATINEPVVDLVGYTTLGTIVDHGTWRRNWTCYMLPTEYLIDLRTLNDHK